MAVVGVCGQYELPLCSGQRLCPQLSSLPSRAVQGASATTPWVVTKDKSTQQQGFCCVCVAEHVTEGWARWRRQGLVVLRSQRATGRESSNVHRIYLFLKTKLIKLIKDVIPS